jgi:hypothetical protein
MMSEQKAADAVKFVFDMLENPKAVSAREGMGDIHAALVPALTTWVNQCNGTRTILMVSPVGSVNYDLMNESSDLDMKALYLPSLSDFYHSKFPQFNFVTDAFDCQLSSAHTYINYVLKGSMNHFELLYAPASLARPDFVYIMLQYLNPMVEMNVKATVRAAWFMALKAHDDASKNGWKPKKASNALRIMIFLITYLDECKFVFTPTGVLRDAILRLKSGDMLYDEYNTVFLELYATARDMAFDPYNGRNDFKFSRDVEHRDKAGTPEWKEMRVALDDEMMKLISAA